MSDRLTNEWTDSFDPASHDGDVSVLTFFQGGQLVATLTGETAEFVHASLLEQAMEQQRRANDVNPPKEEP